MSFEYTGEYVPDCDSVQVGNQARKKWDDMNIA